MSTDFINLFTKLTDSCQASSLWCFRTRLTPLWRALRAATLRLTPHHLCLQASLFNVKNNGLGVSSRLTPHRLFLQASLFNVKNNGLGVSSRLTPHRLFLQASLFNVKNNGLGVSSRLTPHASRLTLSPNVLKIFPSLGKFFL